MSKRNEIAKIVSGGQTGVDRAALDVAFDLGIPCGGWCPKGRRAEDGRIPDRYPLRETASPAYAERTALNVRDSDGTLIITKGPPTGGTALTIQLAGRFGKPCHIVDLNGGPVAADFRRWTKEFKIRVLNVAGPRAGEDSALQENATGFLRKILS